MLERYPLRIGGERREGARTAVVESPWDGEAVGEVALASAADVDDAIALAAASARSLMCIGASATRASAGASASNTPIEATSGVVNTTWGSRSGS